MEITGSAIGKGVAVAGIGGTGGYGIYAMIPGNENSESPMFLFQIDGFGSDSSEYKKNDGSFGYAFGRFMLNPDFDSNLWNENISKVERDKNGLTGMFASLKQETNVSAKLKEIYREIYKKQKTEVMNATSSIPLSGTWQYCSIAQFIPSTIAAFNSDKDKYDGKWARESNNAKALFSTTSSDNDELVWDHIHKRILQKDLKNKKNSINSKFASINSGDKLNEVCEEAYNTDKRDDDVDNYGANVREYCVLDISVELSKYPTKPS